MIRSALSIYRLAAPSPNHIEFLGSLRFCSINEDAASLHSPLTPAVPDQPHFFRQAKAFSQILLVMPGRGWPIQV